MKNITFCFFLAVVVLFAPKMGYCQQESVGYICPGESVTLIAFSDGCSVYEWYRNGEMINGDNDSAYVASDTGMYEVVAYNPGNCASEKSLATRLLPNLLQAYADTAEVFSNKSVNIPVIQNDKQGCVGLVSYTLRIVRFPTKGEALIGEQGIIQYLPYKGQHGEDSFQYELRDTLGNVSKASVLVKVEEEFAVIYPNPVRHLLYIDVVTDKAKYVNLIDATGKTMQQLEITDKKIIMNLESYGSGLYFLTLRDKRGDNLNTYKVVKRGK